MEAKELRLGNWVSLKYDSEMVTYHKVVGIKEDSVVITGMARLKNRDAGKLEYDELNESSGPVDIDDIRGIPLVPETLEKVRFCTLLSIDSFEIVTERRRFVMRRYNDVCFYVYVSEQQIGTVCSLHGLQNKVYTITGGELEINF